MISLAQVIKGMGFLMLMWLGAEVPKPALPRVSEIILETWVEREALTFLPASGEAYFQGIPFTGVAYRCYANEQLAESMKFVEGKRQGPTTRWYPSGQINHQATYQKNQLEGQACSWWETGQIRSEAHYRSGQLHGTLKQWYRSGAPFKELQYSHGQESGLQKAWRENGKLYANYEVRNGRTYGLRRANLCYQLNDEQVQFSTP